jgi:hypothetical protein
MRVTYDCHALQKSGNSPDEYEDACEPSGSGRLVCGTWRGAVADGATETSFSGEWARLLSAAYTRGGADGPGRLLTALPALRERWRKHIAARPLPWYAEEKVRDGAFSSLLGLTLSRSGRWRALACGDSCLMQLRGDHLLTAFPLARAADFTNRPLLLPSAPTALITRRHVLRTSGTWETGDIFFLLTDALAAWFLSEVEAGHTPGRMLESTEHPAAFAQLIASLRAMRVLRNDDVTMMRVAVDDRRGRTATRLSSRISGM